MTASRFSDLPSTIADLPVDPRGYPVPWFVSKIDGEWEFRAVDPWKIGEAHARGICWICGKRFNGSARAFVIGPMCAVNRLSAEPPEHLVCARFAVTACPFLSRPMAKRRDADLPTVNPPAGIMLERNPGVTLLWLTRSYRAEKHDGGLLFRIGSPVALEWYAEGRAATRDEVLASIESGVPSLREFAERDGSEGVALFERMLDRAMRLVPA